MGSRTALVTVCLLVCVGTGSCVLGNDSDRPVLAVDPIWDGAAGDRFIPDTCRGAGVVSMMWEIQDEDGKTLEKSEEPERCAPLDFIGLRPGTYQLVLEGYNEDKEKLWGNTCTDLVLGRFDVLYQCEVDQLEADDTDPGGEDTDAGTPDAG
jgi:hypothetical protein